MVYVRKGDTPLTPLKACVTSDTSFLLDYLKGVCLIVAIYHCSIKIGSRDKGQSAIAAAAYRSGSKLYEKETGLSPDYTKKQGVVYSEISLCANAPQAFQDRATLWNAVQEIESAKNARLWREIEVALPIEFSREQQIDVVRKYVAQLTAQGMCADWSIHDKGDGNPHAHIMLTTRSILDNGSWAPKSKKVYDLDENGEKIFQKTDKTGRKQYKSHKEDFNNWNEKERVEEWRSAWAKCCNELLAEKKIDHRSYKRQNAEKIPTIHEGYAARAIEHRGEISERVEYNRAVKELNAYDTEIRAETELYKAKENQINNKWETVRATLKTEKEKTLAPVPLEKYASKILALRDRYYADSINLIVKNRVRRSTDYAKFTLKSKAERAQTAVKVLPSLAEKVRSFTDKIKSLIFFKRKEKQQLTDERAETVAELKKNIDLIVAIGVGKDYDCENPTESSTNSVCAKANDKIKRIIEEAAEEQKKVDFVEGLSDTTDERIADDLKRLKAAVSDTVSKLTVPERAQLAVMINKAYTPTGNNRVPSKVEIEYSKLIQQISSDHLAQHEREQLPQHKAKRGKSL